MNRRIFFTIVALAASALPRFAERVCADELLPFKGELQGTYTRTGAFPFFRIEPTGKGHATHLGKFSFSIPHDVDLRRVPAGGTGTFEFVAANGDILFGEFWTTATPIPGMPGFIWGVEGMTILGGTGRFVGASGDFLTERLIDTVGLWTAGSFEGTVRLAPPSRP